MLYKLGLTKTKDKFIETAYDDAIKDLGDFFGINWEHNRPQVFVLKDRKTIDNWMNKKTEPWFVAWTDGSRNIFVLDRKNLEKQSSHKYSDEYYAALIKHELSHLFYKILSENRSGPKWFSEGVAIYTSGQTKLKPRPKKFINFLDFYDEVSSETYSEAGFVVELLVKSYGKEKLISLIKELKNISGKEQFEKMFNKIYGFQINYEHLNGLL